jgi:cell division protein ZapA
MADKDNLVHVEIFGQAYAVRGGDEPGYVEKLAAYVDEQMKEVARSSGAVDSLRIAVLAALNIADERTRLRKKMQEADSRARVAGESADQHLSRLAKQLGAALGE